MPWPTPHRCWEKTGGKEGGEELGGEGRSLAPPLSGGPHSPPHPRPCRKASHGALQATPGPHVCQPGQAQGAPWLPWGSRAGSWQPPRVGWSLGSTPPAPMPAPSHGHGALPSRLPPQTPMVLPESPHLVINFIIIQPLLPTPKFITQSKLAEIH